jgi:hypothetical protein
MSTELHQVEDAARRRKVRRSAILFALIAAAFYFSFIVMAVIRAKS